MEWSKKLNLFSQIFTEFHKSTFNFKHFDTTDESQSLCLPKIIDSELRAYVNV